MSVTDEVATELERFRQAAYSLYAASLPREDMERMEHAGLVHEQPLPVDQAIEIMTELEMANREETDLEDEDRVPRLFTLHALADAANRNPALIVDEATRGAIADVILARASDRSREHVLQGLEDFAEAARVHPSGLTPARWHLFLRAIREPDSEAIIVSKPGCNDDEQVPTPEGHAATIKSRFWTNATVKQMAGLVDPKNWETSGTPFWREMSPKPETEQLTTNPPGYTATFMERVMLPLIGEVTVYLDIAFEQTDEYVLTTYQIAANPPHARNVVVFDSGWICATGRTIGPADEPTLVEGLKSIQFNDPLLNNLPDLSCDGGWVYLMINMALKGAALASQSGSTAGAPSPVIGPQGAGAPADVETAVIATIGQVVDTWIVDASGSLRDHGEAVKTAVGRALAPDYDLEWINDLLDTGKGAVETSKHTVQAWRAILDALATLEQDR